jgi:tetratricopeptide (TPR) repeat protein
MADPVPDVVCGHRRRGASAAALIAIAVLIGGCSINLGSLSGSGEKDEAPGASGSVSSLSEAIRNNPNDAVAYNARGLLLAQGGKSEEALADLNKAISLDPAYGHAYANRALVYRHTKRLELAIND